MRSTDEHWPDATPTGPDFPVAGGTFVAVEDFPALLLVQWRAPVTTDISFTLVAGTRIRIDADTRGRPSAVYARPVAYKAVEKAAIPWWTRWRPDYAGFTLCLRTRDLVRHFRPADGRESIPE